MPRGDCVLCRTANQTVIIASCNLDDHGVCYSCYYDLVDAMLELPGSSECLICQGAENCSGRYSLASIRAALNDYPDGNDKFRLIDELEARYVFIQNKKPQEVLL